MDDVKLRKAIGIRLDKSACPNCGNDDQKNLFTVFPNPYRYSHCNACGFSWERTTTFIKQLIRRIKDLHRRVKFLRIQTMANNELPKKVVPRPVPNSITSNIVEKIFDNPDTGEDLIMWESDSEKKEPVKGKIAPTLPNPTRRLKNDEPGTN